MTESPDPSGDAPVQPPTRQMQSWIRRQVVGLSTGYRQDQPAAVSRLASLRQQVHAGETIDLAGWEALSGFPADCLGRGDEPSRWEQASHDALVLFARHQQGVRDQSMHHPDVGLGRAARNLEARFSAVAVGRRFQMLGAAATYGAAVRHLVALSGQLRTARLGLDYALLARDLADLQLPARRDGVRVRWGRDFYAIRVVSTDDSRPDDLQPDSTQSTGDHS